MKIFIVILCLLLSGCFSLHYMNTKSVEGQGDDINAPFGKIKGVNAFFNSTVDLWIPYKPKN